MSALGWSCCSEAWRCRESLQRGTSSLADYSSVENDELAAQEEEIRLRASLAQGRAVLATLLVLAPRGGGVDESQKGTTGVREAPRFR